MTTQPEPVVIPVKPPSRLGAFIRRNPIALKELRGRMRGARAFLVLTAYLALMSGFAAILYGIYLAQSSVQATSNGGQIGKLIFGGVVAIELFLVCFIAPAFTSGSISGERERRTFHILRTTLLPARRIVMGKLLSALAYIVLLLLAAVPLQSLAFLMGGVTPPEVLISIEMLIVTAIGFGVAGIYFSAVTARTLGASVLTYVVILLIVIAVPLAGLSIFGIIEALLLNSSQPLVEAIVLYGFGFLGSTNPISAAVLSEIALLDKGSAFYFTITLNNGTPLPFLSPWIVYTILYLVLSLGMIMASIRRVRKFEV